VTDYYKFNPALNSIFADTSPVNAPFLLDASFERPILSAARIIFDALESEVKAGRLQPHTLNLYLSIHLII